MNRGYPDLEVGGGKILIATSALTNFCLSFNQVNYLEHPKNIYRIYYFLPVEFVLERQKLIYKLKNVFNLRCYS